MKKILTFKNTDNYNYFNSCQAIEKIKEILESMQKDGKTYMITIEEVEEI